LLNLNSGRHVVRLDFLPFFNAESEGVSLLDELGSIVCGYLLLGLDRKDTPREEEAYILVIGGTRVC